MSVSKCLMTAALVGAISTAPACTQKPADETRKAVDVALDATETRADKAIAATKKAGEETAAVALRAADKTTDLARDVAKKSKDVALATGAAVADGWITTKVKAKFADERLLRGSDINVDTSDHVVTLKGAVLSGEAKARAAVIARGTEGVTRVVNQLVVK